MEREMKGEKRGAKNEKCEVQKEDWGA